MNSSTHTSFEGHLIFSEAKRDVCVMLCFIVHKAIVCCFFFSVESAKYQAQNGETVLRIDVSAVRDGLLLSKTRSWKVQDELKHEVRGGMTLMTLLLWSDQTGKDKFMALAVTVRQ
jgi:hypothetical protein